MRGIFTVTIGLSLGVHLAVAAALLAPRRIAAHEAPDPAPQMAGETFELPAPETTSLPPPAGDRSPESAAEVAEADAPGREEPAVRKGGPPTKAKPARHSAAAAEGHAGASSAAPDLPYGAVGERSASDLATTFTRGFPQAASADPSWRAAPLGSAGEADVVLSLDESGHLEHWQVLGAPGPALSSAIKRTLALIKGRPFVARAKITKLHLTASVSADAVHDGLHGDVFAIGGSFAGGDGSAFFALAIGRRIDVHVRRR